MAQVKRKKIRKVSLALGGVKQLALGHDPYPWEFNVIEVKEDGSRQGIGDPDDPIVGEVFVNLPSEEFCRGKALEELKKVLESIRADNEKRERIILDQIQNLLALPAPSAS